MSSPENKQNDSLVSAENHAALDKWCDRIADGQETHDNDKRRARELIASNALAVARMNRETDMVQAPHYPTLEDIIDDVQNESEHNG